MDTYDKLTEKQEAELIKQLLDMKDSAQKLKGMKHITLREFCVMKIKSLKTGIDVNDL